MSPITIQWIAVVCIVAVGVLFLTEIYRWSKKDSIVSFRQKVLRCVLAILIEALLVMIFLGPVINKHKDPVSEIIYWMFCFVIAMSVAVVALMDFKEIAKSYAALNKQMFRGLRGEDLDKK